MNYFAHRFCGRVAVAAVLVAVLCVPVQAASLVDYFGSAVTSGTSPYAGATLNGTVAYAVFTESDFESNFGGFDVPAGEWAYVYQVLNGNGDPISSNAIVGINNNITGIGDATIDGGAGETLPQSSVLNLGISAVWDFSGIGNNIPTSGRSDGLILTSGYKPGPATTLNILVDGGGSAIAYVVTPGDIAIPEPASLPLMGLGVAALFVRRRVR